jgi:hypothetical protein
VLRTADDGSPPSGRSEYKYTVTEAEAHAIARWAAPWVRPDKHVLPGQRDYTITSLYLDTPDLAFLWAKRTLQYARVKARVRTYGIEADGPVFVELKRRYGDVMVKTRAHVEKENWRGLLDPLHMRRAPEDLAVTHAGRAAVTDFVSLARSHALRPIVLVRYEREPHIGLINPRTRLTFDRSLRARPASTAVLEGGDKGYRAVDYAAMFDRPMSQVIVEMKFDGVAPLWMQDLIYRFELLRSAFSKYAVAIDVLADEARIDAPGRLRGLGA